MKISRRIGSSFGAFLLVATPLCATAQTVASFTVVNADNGADIATFTTSGMVSIVNTPNINVRANVSNVGSVVFKDGTASRTENAAPYTYKGDKQGIYYKWSPAAGTYTITAKPFSGAGGTGTAGELKTLTLTITTTTSGTTPGTGTGTTTTSGTTTGTGTGTGTTTGTGTATTTSTGTGKLMIDPDSPHHFVYDRDSNGDGKRDPVYLAGVGGPEGFLYESPTRKQLIINKLLKSSKLDTPVNGIYFHSTRAFGGDGNGFETPFINYADPRSGFDTQKLASWRKDLKRLDDAGVILWFNLFDDHAVPYGCKYNADYQKYATDMVNQFKDLKHIVWVTQEEYRWTTDSQTSCSLADNDARQRGLAAAIRSADPVHPIATHHMNGQGMNFGGDPNIGVFGQQTSVRSPDLMHDTAGLQGWGNWVYVMAEDHSWHQDLIDQERTTASGRSLMRRSNWATAMSGGYVMMYNSFECGNSAKLCNDGTTDSDPTDDMLDDLRRLKQFMESTQFNRVTPLFNSALTSAKLDGTKYILANQSTGLYILYGDTSTTKLGVRNAPAGNYALTWFDPVSGTTIKQSGEVAAGNSASFSKPGEIGSEAVLYMRKL
jgi:hypothetical protein